MPIENEFKFMLNPCMSEYKLQELNCKSINIHQYYIMLDKKKSLRIRELIEKESRYVMTFKQHESGFNREVEIDISKEDYLAIQKNHKAKLIKTRYYYNEWEVDFFRDKNDNIYFVQAEIELPENMACPELIPKIIKENLLYVVDKDDRRFSSRRLADVRYAKKLITKITGEKND